MKVLFVGVYDNGTGWGNAGQDYILALDAAGIEVVPRSTFVINSNGEVPNRIKELEKRSSKGCDIVIQNVLPNFMDYNGLFDKCIGLYMTETSHFKNSGWAYYLNLLDEIWVPCMQMKDAAQATGVVVPSSILPIPCDVSKYAKRYEAYSLPETDGRFVFYTIGELTRRKNLVALLKAFHTEFHPHEPVSLLIKANLPGHSLHDCNRHLRGIIDKVKAELKLYANIGNYHNEVIIMQDLNNQEIMRLHATCNCFVMPSFGEAWNIPAFDAMAMGNTPICTDVGGMRDFISTPTGNAGWLIKGNSTPCFGMNEGCIKNMYVGDEEWIDVDIRELRKAMREAYENKDVKQEKAALGIERAYDFSYESVGQLMANALRSSKPIGAARDSNVCKSHSLDFLKG